MRVDTTISWFKDEDIDVGLLYFHEPDDTGHYHGPSGEDTIKMVQEVDIGLGYLMDQLQENGLSDEVHVGKIDLVSSEAEGSDWLLFLVHR